MSELRNLLPYHVVRIIFYMCMSVDLNTPSKRMNPGHRSEFKNVRIWKWKRFGMLKDLRAFLTTKVPSVDVGGEKPDYDHVDLGYLEPGHGTKGKKQWLNTDEDIQVMYENHAGKRSIQLWVCPTCSRKEW